MDEETMMVPVYAGYQSKKEESKTEEKKQKYDTKKADDKTKYDQNKNSKYWIPLFDEEEERRKLMFPYASSPFGMPSTRKDNQSMLPYMLPPSQAGRFNDYGLAPAMGRGMTPASQGMMQQPMPMQAPAGYGNGNTAQIQINYTAPDGTMYQMGVTSSAENRGRALYNTLAGLYGLMMAEGKGAKYGGKGGAYSGAGGKYAGGGGGYSGGGGSSGGKGGK